MVPLVRQTRALNFAVFEEGDGNEQQLVSSIPMITLESQASMCYLHRQLENVGISSTLANTLMMNEERRMATSNNFHGCQVTVNYQL